MSQFSNERMTYIQCNLNQFGDLENTFILSLSDKSFELDFKEHKIMIRNETQAEPKCANQCDHWSNQLKQ